MTSGPRDTLHSVTRGNRVVDMRQTRAHRNNLVLKFSRDAHDGGDDHAVMLGRRDKPSHLSAKGDE
jgi:hypothetical protein